MSASVSSMSEIEVSAFVADAKSELLRVVLVLVLVAEGEKAMTAAEVCRSATIQGMSHAICDLIRFKK